MPSENNFIEPAHFRDQKFTKTLYKKCKPKCIAWLGKNSSLTLDDRLSIYQDAFVILFDNVTNKKLVKFTVSAESYLLGICKNRLYEIHRKKKKWHLWESFNHLADIIEIDEDPSYRERLKNVVQALNQIGDLCKKLIELSFYDKLSSIDIAKEMGYANANTAKTKKYKCLQKLRSLIVRAY